MDVETIDHGEWLEMRAIGEITPEEWVRVEEMGFPEGLRLLIDYTRVTNISVPLEDYIEAARAMERLKLRVGLLAPAPLPFGIGRQTLQTAGIPEGESFSVFRERDAAIAWLLGSGPPEPGKGSVTPQPL